MNVDVIYTFHRGEEGFNSVISIKNGPILRAEMGVPRCQLKTHSRRALFRVFDIGFEQIEDILGIILMTEFFKKSN